jgi:Ser/Thr protein kinase RdoA (MazF antagonist)
MSTEEEALTGGFVTPVVKVGNTVRRRSGPWTSTVQRLLAHVRARGLGWVPEPLGFDEAGREILSFIPGEVPHDTAEWIRSEQVLTDVARALRQWHDATVGFSVPDATWSLTPPGPREVICHNDFAPYNCVFRDGRFVGAIDFDQCAPGPRLWDIAYTAYRFVPLTPGLDGDAPSAARLELFLSSYAAAGAMAPYARAQVVGAAIERLHALASWTEDHVHRNGVAALAEHAAMYRRHAQWLGYYP